MRTNVVLFTRDLRVHDHPALSAALWPGMAIVDRFLPDRRSGAWPPLLRNGRIFRQEVAAHAIFGGVLGALLRAEHRAAGR